MGYSEEKSAEGLFLSNLSLIEEVIRYVCFAYGIRGDDANEFASEVKLKLIKDNYAVLQKFQGRCSLRTYLNTVINRFLIDQRIAHQGRWRPSEEAKKSGEIAVKLEELIYKQKHSFEEAWQILTTNYGYNVSRDEMHVILSRIRAKKMRDVRADPEELQRIAVPVAATGDWKADTRGHKIKEKAEQMINEYVSLLPDEDQLILRMRFKDGFKVSEIASALGIVQKQLYWRIDKILKELKARLLSTGIQEEDILEVFQEYDSETEIHFKVKSD